MKKIMFNDKYGLTQAVLEGRMTQTRRIAYISHYEFEVLNYKYPSAPLDLIKSIMSRSQYKVGEIVAIAQSYMVCGNFPVIEFDKDGYPIMPEKSGYFNKMYVKPELMPHKIRITKVRIERLQDIRNEDCLKEGIVVCEDCVKCYFLRKDDYDDCSLSYKSPREAYSVLIDKIVKKGTWESNPYVFVYEFELLTSKN